NILEECNYPNRLLSTLRTKTASTFKANYHDKDHLFLAQALDTPGLPYYLLLFEEDIFYVSSHIQIITFVVFFLFALLVLISLTHIFFLKVVGSARKKSRNTLLERFTLYPKKELKKSYSFLNSLLFLVLVIQLLFLLLPFFKLNLPDHFYNIISLSPFFQISLLFALLLISYAIIFWKNVKGKSKSHLFWAIPLAIVLFLLIPSLFSKNEPLHYIILIPSGFLFVLPFLNKLPLIPEIKSRFPNGGFHKIISYFSFSRSSESAFNRDHKLFMVLSVIIFGILPTFIFFNIAYEQEFGILTKYREMGILEKATLKTNREEKLKNYPFNLKYKKEKEYYAPYYSLSYDSVSLEADLSEKFRFTTEKFFYIFPYRIFKGKNQMGKKTLEKDTSIVKTTPLYEQLISLLRVPINPYSRNTLNLSFFPDGDTPYKESRVDNHIEALELNNIKVWKKTGLKKDLSVLSYISAVRTFLFVIPIIVFFIGLFVMLWRFIGIIIKPAAHTNGKQLNNWDYKSLRQQLQSILSPKEKSQELPHIMIHTPPESGAKRELLEILKENSHQIEIRDMAEIIEQYLHTPIEEVCFPELSAPVPIHNHHVFLLQNFNYLYKEHQSNLLKLKYLQQLLKRHPFSQIIVISNTSLDSFYFESPENQINESYGNTFLNRWHIISHDFINFYYPMKRMPKGEGQNLIESECNFGSYLPKIKPLLEFSVGERNQQNAEQMVIEITKKAHSYYQSIWDTLTVEEQYLIFDLAENDLTYIKSHKTIDTLLQKGLLKIKKERLHLFNNSFKYFILTEADHTDISRFEKEFTYNIWEKLKFPFLLILTALFLFILISQGISLKHFIPLVTILGTGLPTLFNISPNITTKTHRLLNKILYGDY
ncbi:hypothetical protein, partial [Xanthovirga aplysinae]|uniref:hypothetical protein n=1 Tax=Xanthovirga aplysinae TaxID=2529853 RepID=UPI001656C6B3